MIAEPNGVADDRRWGIRDLRRHTARGMVTTSAFQVLLIVISALRGLIVAAFISRSAYGVWGLIGVTLWTAVGLKNLFGANDKYVQQSEDDQALAFRRAFTIELLFAAWLAPVAAAVVVGYAFLTGETVIILPGLVLLLLLPSAALQFPLAIFYRQMDYKRQRLLSAFEPIAGAIIMVVLAILGAGYWSFVIGAVAGSWIGAVVALVVCPFRLGLHYDRGTIGQYVRFSFPLLVTGLSAVGMFQALNLIGVGIIGLAGIGTFTLAGNLLQFANQADGIITNTLYPAICTVRDRVDLLTEIFIKSNRLSLIWAVPFGVGMAVFASDLVHYVLGSRWTPAIPLLEMLGFVTALNHVGYNWGAFVKARGITWPLAVSGVIVTVATVAVAEPLMQSYGVKGLGYAFLIGGVVSLLIRSVWLARFFNHVSILSQLMRAFAPTALAAAAILLLRLLAHPDSALPSAIATFVLYALITVGATFALERTLLREAVGYLLSRRRAFATAEAAGFVAALD